MASSSTAHGGHGHKKNGSFAFFFWCIGIALLLVGIAIVVGYARSDETSSTPHTASSSQKTIETVHKTVSSKTEAECGKKYVFTILKGGSITLSDRCWASLDATKGAAMLHLQNGKKVEIRPNLNQTLDSKVTDITPLPNMDEVRIVVLACHNGMRSTEQLTCI